MGAKRAPKASRKAKDARKRASGGSRRSADVAAARAAARGPGYDAAELARYEAVVGPMPTDVKLLPHWQALSVAFCCDSAMRDPGLPWESRREQIARLSPQLSRALNPAEQAQELRAIAAEWAKARAKRREIGAMAPDEKGQGTDA